jgi:hypothetical protein
MLRKRFYSKQTRPQTEIPFGGITAKQPRKKKSAAEYHLQVTCVKWFDIAYPEYRLKFFHIPNQSIMNNARAGAFLKSMGRRAGVLDCLLVVKRENNCGLFMDFKSKQGVLSEAQNLFIKEMKGEGYECVEIESLEQFISVINAYLGISQRIKIDF